MDLNHSLWGVDIPNAVKGINVVWDPVDKQLYAAAIANPWMMVIRPENSHPSRFINLDVGGTHTNRMVIDPERRSLFWISGPTEEIRVVDLESQMVTHQHTPSEQYKGYPVQGVALDPATGWIWVVNKVAKRVKGYSPDLQQTKTIPTLSGPVGIASDPNGDGLFIIDGHSKQSARLVHFQPSTNTVNVVVQFEGRGRPPKHVAVTSDGYAVTGSRDLKAYDRSGNIMWRSPLPHPAANLAAAGDVVVAIVSSSQAPAKVQNRPDFNYDPKDGVVVVDSKTGQLKAKATLRYESTRLSLDAEGRRAFVGNGGDGSVSVVSLDDSQEPKLIDVANAAEGAVADSRTGRRFILNRLGGSEIYTWTKQGLDRYAKLPWPFELAIDEDRRQLMAVSYYEATVYRWNLDTNQALPSIHLGIPKGKGDTLGDVHYDPKTGKIAVILPQEGWVALANVDTGQSEWTHQIEGMERVGGHAGPGRGLLAFGNNQLVVIGGTPSKVTALSLTNGSVLKSASLPNVGRLKFRLNSLYYDEAGDRFFYGGHVIHSSTLTVQQSLPQVDKVFYADSNRILAMDIDGRTEFLVTLDAISLRETGRWPITESDVMRTESTYDPVENVVLISDLPNAEVWAVPLPR